MKNQFDELAKGLAQSVMRRQSLKRFGAGLAGMALACFGLVNSAGAASPAFTTIDFPNSLGTSINGLAPSGSLLIVGDFLDANTEHGYFLRNGAFIQIDYPGSIFTEAFGVTTNGIVVGGYGLANSSGNGTTTHGYLFSTGTFTAIDFPGANSFTEARGINSGGDIVGIYFIGNGVGQGESPLSSGNGHGFLLRRGIYSSIDFPGAILTEAWKITDSGRILGRYKSSNDGNFHLFILANGSFTSVPDVPNGIATASSIYSSGDLTDAGDIVGDYSDAAPIFKHFGGMGQSGNLNGFLSSKGAYTTIDFPGATVTATWAVNSSGCIAGTYLDANSILHGFVRTP